MIPIQMRSIDGTKLKEYLTCPRLPYLAFHGPREVPEPTERMRLLFESGYRIEEAILKDLGAEEVEFPERDYEAGFAATKAMMAGRTTIISNGVLLGDGTIGRPDLLVWNKADERYEVADIKSSSIVHASARLQVTFYSRMLEDLQDAPRTGYVITRDGSKHAFLVADLSASLDHLLHRIDSFRRDPKNDPGPHRQLACDDCRFAEVCDEELAARDDLRLLPSLTRAQADAFCRAGTRSVTALSTAEVRPLSRETGLPEEAVRRLRREAESVRLGRPVIHGQPGVDLAKAAVAIAVVLETRLPDPAVAVAGRVLAPGGATRVRHLSAGSAASPEAAMAEWKEFLARLSKSRGPILVYGRDFSKLLDLARRRWPGVAFGVTGLQARLLDLRDEVRRTAALPGSDHNAFAALVSAGLATPDSALHDEVARYLEGAKGGRRDAIDAVLHAELDAIASLREFALSQGSKHASARSSSARRSSSRAGSPSKVVNDPSSRASAEAPGG